MRIVLSSDWHCDVKTSGFPRFDDVAAAARQTVEHAIRVKADLWAMLGDLADPDDGPDALRAVELAVNIADSLSHHQIRNVWVKGNHDDIASGEGRSVLTPVGALLSEWTTVCDEPGGFITDDGVAVTALPYSSASTPYDPAGFMRARVALVRERVRTGVVLGHCTALAGVRQGEETLEMPRGRSVPMPMEEIPLGWAIFNGHYHTPQTTPSGVVIPGSLCRLTHGEEHQPRFLDVEI